MQEDAKLDGQKRVSNAGIKKRPPAPQFSEFVKQFEKWLVAERADEPNTVQFYKDRIRQLLMFDKLRNAPLDAIDEQFVAAYIQWRTNRTRQYALRKKNGVDLADTFEPVSVGCANRDLAALRRVLNVARTWSSSPSFRSFGCFPVRKPRTRAEPCRRRSLPANAPLLLGQFATVMLDTGMRPEEVCRMQWENVYLDPVNGSRFGYVHNPRGKTKWAKRNLSLTARVHGLLSMRHEEAGKPAKGWVFPGGDPAGHVSYSTVDSQHGRTIEKLNAPDADGSKPKNPITPFRLYDLRHTFLTRLGEANTDPFSIQRIAGFQYRRIAEVRASYSREASAAVN